jgi:hypothetical protein
VDHVAPIVEFPEAGQRETTAHYSGLGLHSTVRGFSLKDEDEDVEMDPYANAMGMARRERCN